MQYFNTLPKIQNRQPNGNLVSMTNLMARSSIISTLLKNPVVFYSYDIQDGDTPEIISYKYYGDVYRYWIILFANQILDPQWEWPMNNLVFNEYIATKYPNTDPYTTINHYEENITKIDLTTNTKTEETIIIDLETYTNLQTGTHTYNLPTGSVEVTIDKRAVNIYTAELEKNESKRNIKLLKTTFVDVMEQQLKSLMAQ